MWGSQSLCGLVVVFALQNRWNYNADTYMYCTLCYIGSSVNNY